MCIIPFACCNCGSLGSWHRASSVFVSFAEQGMPPHSNNALSLLPIILQLHLFSCVSISLSQTQPRASLPSQCVGMLLPLLLLFNYVCLFRL